MSPIDKLTDRQLQIIMHLCNGLRLEEISTQMYLSVSGINQQITSARRTMKARTNVHLASMAIASGLLYYLPDDRERTLSEPVQGSVEASNSARNHEAPHAA
jgi:DNA-binding CsgD family transcriptional regulator